MKALGPRYSARQGAKQTRSWSQDNANTWRRSYVNITAFARSKVVIVIVKVVVRLAKHEAKQVKSKKFSRQIERILQKCKGVTQKLRWSKIINQIIKQDIRIEGRWSSRWSSRWSKVFAGHDRTSTQKSIAEADVKAAQLNPSVWMFKVSTCCWPNPNCWQAGTFCFGFWSSWKFQQQE